MVNTQQSKTSKNCIESKSSIEWTTVNAAKYITYTNVSIGRRVKM